MALIIQLLLASMLVQPGAESSGYYRRAELIHVDANGGFTREELIRRAADRAHLRAAMLSPADLAADTQDKKMKVQLEQLEGQSSHFEYLMHMEVDMDGPPRRFVADTGSDMIWMKKEAEPSTLEAVACSCTAYAFTKTYGSEKKAVKGFFCKDRELSFLSPSKTKETTTTTMPAVKKDRIGLGFATHYDHDLIPESADGVVGLSGGRWSLVSQLGVTTFSYCLANTLTKEPFNSPFWFGGDPIYGDSELTSTPLVEVPPHVDRYYVELLGISIEGGKKKELPGARAPKALTQLPTHYFEHKSHLFIDSGCSHTKLETPVFEKLKSLLADELERKLSKDDKVHTCFPPDTPKKAPTLVLHLKGLEGDVRMRIPWDNYMLQLKGETDFCLAIHESTAGESILGNIQQHNIYMHYDLTKKPGKLSFKEDSHCSEL